MNALDNISDEVFQKMFGVSKEEAERMAIENTPAPNIDLAESEEDRIKRLEGNAQRLEQILGMTILPFTGETYITKNGKVITTPKI
jgi:hypothetical protein